MSDLPLQKRKASGLLAFLIILVSIALFIFVFTGFFVIQPLGAIPEGVTIWYWRIGYKLPFILSADGLIYKETKSLNLITRISTLSSLMDLIKDRVILRLPYSRSLYLISTGGLTFSQ